MPRNRSLPVKQIVLVVLIAIVLFVLLRFVLTALWKVLLFVVTAGVAVVLAWFIVGRIIGAGRK